MKQALNSVVFSLFLALTVTAASAMPALADDMPTIKLLMKDGHLIPETLVVPANTRFRLEVTNEGPGAAEFESLELRKELVMAPGVTRTEIGPDAAKSRSAAVSAGSGLYFRS